MCSSSVVLLLFECVLQLRYWCSSNMFFEYTVLKVFQVFFGVFFCVLQMRAWCSSNVLFVEFFLFFLFYKCLVFFRYVSVLLVLRMYFCPSDVFFNFIELFYRCFIVLHTSPWCSSNVFMSVFFKRSCLNLFFLCCFRVF